MREVKIKVGNNTRLIHRIFDIPLSPKSYSSALLLKKNLRNLDLKHNRNDNWHFLFIAKRTYLRHQRIEGKWICHYCKEPIYKMSPRGVGGRHKDVITIDHKIPICDIPITPEIEDITDSKNFVPCCYKCNAQKGSKSYEEFKEKKQKTVVEELTHTKEKCYG